MNDFSELEAELKKLKPSAVSPELLPRIERLLIETPTAAVLPRPRKVSVNWFALGFGLAATAAILMLARPNVDRHPKTTPTIANNGSSQVVAPTLLPEGLTRVVYNTRDDGLVYPDNFNEPVRRLRSRSRETMQWKDPSSGASLRVSYPTEEVRLIPVSMSVQ